MLIKKSIIIFFIFFSLVTFIFNLQAVAYSNSTQFVVPSSGDEIQPSDYNNPNNWLALPGKKDLIRNVDIFFIYPTAWRANGQYPIAEIDNQEMRHWAKYYLKFRASAFNTAGNIFAPYYRQLDAFFAVQIGSPQKAYLYYQGIPKTDILAAFDYYIKNFNNNKPFILAGHSQGSIMIAEILSDYMKANPEVYKRMIAAYAIGIPLTKTWYLQNPHLKPAQGATDIGVVISYNTEAPVIDGKNPMSNPDTVTINPISWKITDEYVSKNNNLGSIYVDKNWKLRKSKHVADAKINFARGTIICSTVDREKWSSQPASRAYFPLGVFHENDIPLYYYNLRKNAEDRVAEYFKYLQYIHGENKRN
ncbi:MAG: DUF3089 domain-containing protein [Endomicrobium sp.]|jgi:hypothetical protein|nr:DUF3089 domain-containing protein [Endomicrobium sp.]